jgi:hypothetical protein
MSQPATTIVATALIGALIALSVAITNRWTIIPGVETGLIVSVAGVFTFGTAWALLKLTGRRAR